MLFFIGSAWTLFLQSVQIKQSSLFSKNQNDLQGFIQQNTFRYASRVLGMPGLDAKKTAGMRKRS
jgi:hypothetical protein